jgi:hypothetical protein
LWQIVKFVGKPRPALVGVFARLKLPNAGNGKRAAGAGTS